MESKVIKDINFLKKQVIKAENLKYVLNTKDVYANLYEIKLTKELKLFQYPFTVVPQIEAGDIRIREKLFKTLRRQLRAIYDDCFVSGDCLYSMKKVNENKVIKCSLVLRGKTDYTITILPNEQERSIKSDGVIRTIVSY